MTTSLDLDAINQQLRNEPSREIIRWALGKGNKPILTTNFSSYEALNLHMVSQTGARNTCYLC